MTDSTRRDDPDGACPLHLDSSESGDYAKFLLHSRTEILFILRALRDAGSLITVYFNHGNDFLLSSLLAVNGETSLVFDPGSNAEMNRKALAADKLTCITTHEKIKIQFGLRGLAKVQYKGRDAFRAAVPGELLRLQRREYYRLTVPLAQPVKCLVPTRLADGSRTTLETNVIDISGGGVALALPPEGAQVETDRLFENCRIELPEVGTVTADLRVRNLFEIALRSGAKVTRSGCQFVDLPSPMLTLIQRYILRVERERKAREMGMM